jgi:hypothetical protein
MLKSIFTFGSLVLSLCALVGCGGGGSSEATYTLPEGTSFTIYLTNPTTITSGGVRYNFADDTITNIKTGVTSSSFSDYTSSAYKTAYDEAYKTAYEAAIAGGASQSDAEDAARAAGETAGNSAKNTADASITQAAENLRGNSISAIFVAGESLTGTIYINPNENACIYSMEGNLESTFNLTIKWGSVFDDAQGTIPETIRLKNCTIADRKVYGSVDSWTFSYNGMAVAGKNGTVNPL